MKTIKLLNKDLVEIYGMLEKLVVEKYKPKRGKGNLSRQIKAKHEEYVEDLKDIQDKYFKKDDEGNFIKEHGPQGNSLVWLDKWDTNVEEKEKVNNVIKELLDEESVISIVEHESKIKSFFEAVQDDAFTVKDGFKDEPFDILMDALEETFNKEEENE